MLRFKGEIFDEYVEELRQSLKLPNASPDVLSGLITRLKQNHSLLQFYGGDASSVVEDLSSEVREYTKKLEDAFQAKLSKMTGITPGRPKYCIIPDIKLDYENHENDMCDEQYERFVQGHEKSYDILGIWLRESKLAVASMGSSTILLICSSQNNYKKYWDLFDKPCLLPLEQENIKDNKLAMDFMSAFRNQPAIPEGVRLFEGQGRYENDLVDMFYNRDLKEGSVIYRNRPTRTSWIPNVGINFLSCNFCLQAGNMANAMLNGAYKTDGVLAIYTIREPVIALNVLALRLAPANEAVILLAPHTKLVVTKIEENVETCAMNINRACNFDGLRKIDIVHLDVYPGRKHGIGCRDKK